MRILILISVVLAVGIWLGFIIGFSRAMREAAARMQRPKGQVIGWLFIAGACICLVIAACSSLYSWHFVTTAARTTGTVTGMREHTDQEHSDTTYAPTFSFRDAAGTEYNVVSTLYSSPPKHRVGDTVPILYRPTNPQSARIDGYWYVWGVPTITGLIAGLYLPAGFVVLFWPRILARFKKQPI